MNRRHGNVSEHICMNYLHISISIEIKILVIFFLSFTTFCLRVTIGKSQGRLRILTMTRSSVPDCDPAGTNSRTLKINQPPSIQEVTQLVYCITYHIPNQ